MANFRSKVLVPRFHLKLYLLIIPFVVWLAIPRPSTKSFLGLDWKIIFPHLRGYFTPRMVEFGLLCDLQLSIARTDVVNDNIRGQTPSTAWLHKQYCQFSIHIYDLGKITIRYRIPLIEISVDPVEGSDTLEPISSEVVSRIIPAQKDSLRIIIFPQTRYSFIEDKVLHLYQIIRILLTLMTRYFMVSIL
jgi:hypothetical protein